MGQDLGAIFRGFLAILLLVGMLGAAGPALAASYRLFLERRSDRLVRYLSLLFFVIAIHILGFIPITAPLPRPLPQGVNVMLIADLVLLGIGIVPAALAIIFPKERPRLIQEPLRKVEQPMYSRNKRAAIALIGFGQMTVAMITLVGYATNYQSLYQWSERAIGMAPNTAVCFLLSGIGFLIISLAKSK